jgi:hypothetical protein
MTTLMILIVILAAFIAAAGLNYLFADHNEDSL